MQMKPNKGRALLSTRQSCCEQCQGRDFCSPESMNCYDSKDKDYYLSCSGGSDGGLAPGPSPGGLAPGPSPAACCSSCNGHGYCSPVSGNCYESKAKSYYESCSEVEPDIVVIGDLSWADEFDGINGAVNSSHWRYENGDNFKNNQELQYYTDRPENSFIEDGILKIVAKCDDYDTWKYTSARLTTKHRLDWGPGHRIEVRAKVPTGIGTWPAIWMLPVDNVYGGWPDSGEIDIMESVGCTHGKVYGTVHTGAYNHMKNTQVGSNYETDYGGWHTYAFDWLDDKMYWYVDGELYHTFAPDTGDHAKWPFSQQFYLILNVAVDGSWGGFCLDEAPSCNDNAEFGEEQIMEVDYVRVNRISVMPAATAA